MADITLSTLIDTFLQEGTLDATQKDSIREDLGLKTTDAVTFKNLVLTGLSLTGSQATSSLDIAATWNTSGTPTAFKLNVTNTASNSSSLLMDLCVGGSSRFKVSRDGTVRITGSGVPILEFGAGAFFYGDGGGLKLRAAYGSEFFELQAAGFGAATSHYIYFKDALYLGTNGTNTLQLGLNHATTPTAQTIKAHDVTTGTGADLCLKGGAGSVAKGNVILDGGNRMTPTDFSTQELWHALCGYGLIKPPLDSYSTTYNVTPTSIEVILNGANTNGFVYNVEAEISTNNVTFTPLGEVAAPGASANYALPMASDLTPDTGYYFRWRSYSGGFTESAVYTDWSPTQFLVTVPEE